MDTKKLLAISKKARQERKQEKEKRRQEKLQAVENEEEIVEEMLKNQPIKVREKRETRSSSEGNDGQIEKAQDRLEVLKKIEEFEREGKFDVDVEEDPPTIVLTPENIDYLREKMSSKIKRIFANEMGERFLDNLLKNNKLIIKQVNGIENLNKVKTGALITCNHFNPFDCFTVEKVFRMSENEKDKRLYKVIREGNYTNFPGLYGFFFRNCDTLPLSSNKRTMVNFMKAVDTILQKGDYILIYPEQSMWWNYRKPKPLKNGAFKLAARNNVPVIPIFITMEDSKLIGEDGFNIQEYTINVEEPIYPDEKLTEKENTEIMKQKKKMTSTGFLLLITIVLFFVMYAAGMVIFADKGFAKPQMFLNLFVSNAGLLVISCGLTIVMITGGIDISVGSVTALVCMVMADLMENKGVSAYVAVLAALLIGLAFGIVQGFLVTYMGIQPFIVTLAGMFFGRGMTAIISTDMISIKNEVFLKWANYRFYMPFGSTNKKGKFIPAYIPPTVVIAIIVVLIIAVLLKYFKFGRKLYAIGGNRQSALMMGLDVKKTMFRAYVLDGFLAGLGGFLFCLNSCAGFVEQAKGLEMDAISSAVIGGTLLSGGVGTPIGSLFGVLIKGTISSLITAQGTLSSWWVRIVLSALLCFFIVIQSVLASAKKKK